MLENSSIMLLSVNQKNLVMIMPEIMLEKYSINAHLIFIVFNMF